MKKRNKTITAYHVIGLIGFILVILSLIFGKENLYDKSIEAEAYEIKPVCSFIPIINLFMSMQMEI